MSSHKCQRAQNRETSESAPESALGSALRNRRALRSAPESALEVALPVILHRTPGVVTPSACYRGSKPQSSPTWLGEGAIAERVSQESLAQVQAYFAPVQPSFAPI